MSTVAYEQQKLKTNNIIINNFFYLFSGRHPNGEQVDVQRALQQGPAVHFRQDAHLQEFGGGHQSGPLNQARLRYPGWGSGERLN